MKEQDSLQRFLFVNNPVRGVMVHLKQSYDAVLERHPYPLPIKKLLGETLVATSLLSGTIKFSGSLILQIHGHQQIKLLVAQADSERHIRGLAQWEGVISDDSFVRHLAKGRLVITISPKDSVPYQGIVELKDESLAQALENYFAQSEQLPTFVYLAADENSAAGMLLQILPGQYDRDPGLAWEHLTQLSRTLSAKEMLSLSSQQILTRLYSEEDIQLFDPEPIVFYCDCNRSRMEQAILTMGYKDAIDFVTQEKKITVICEFCNRHMDFDAVDVEEIFGKNNQRSS